MFDESFLEKRKEKVAAWNAKGVKAGHGGVFGTFTAKPPKQPSNKSLTNDSSETKARQTTAKTSKDLTPCKKLYLEFIKKHEKRLNECFLEKKRLGRLAKDNMSVYSYALALFRQSKTQYETYFKGNAEHWEQIVVFDRISEMFPMLFEYMAAMPNGGYRTPKAAGMIKAEGGKKGYPDILIDLPKGKYPGLRLEMKVKTGSLQQEQKAWMNRLHGVGYFVALAWSAEEAIDLISNYARLEHGESMPEIPSQAKWLK